MQQQQEYKRGQVWLTHFQAAGHAQGGIRYAVIISNDTGNKFSPCLIVAPCTTQEKKELPTHVMFKINGVINTVLCEQLVTVDKFYTEKLAGVLPEKTMQQINNALLVSLGLQAV